MRQTISVKFFARKDRAKAEGLIPVFMRIGIGPKRLNMITKIYVKYEDWSVSSGMLKGNTEQIKTKRTYKFADDFPASSPPDVTVTIEAPAPFVVKGWRASFANWILTSDLQPGVYFSDEGNLVARDIFPGRKSFLK